VRGRVVGVGKSKEESTAGAGVTRAWARTRVCVRARDTICGVYVEILVFVAQASDPLTARGRASMLVVRRGSPVPLAASGERRADRATRRPSTLPLMRLS
jgi:hypothetical protein